MRNIKIKGKYVLFQGIESIYYDADSKKVVVVTFSGEKHSADEEFDEEKALVIMERLFEKIHKYNRGLL